MATLQTQRSIPDVLQDIIRNLQRIIRYEFRLAKTELQETATRIARPAATFGIGLLFGFYGVGFLLLACVYALSTVVAGWLAALLVGAVVVVLSAALMSFGGKKLKEINSTPDKTI
jgi:uncharacterized membrane protein YqjE